MRKKVKQLIKSQDLVGHPVALSYNSNGSVHKTFLGGAISCLVLIFMLKITYSKTYVMVTHGDDTISKINHLMSDKDLV